MAHIAEHGGKRHALQPGALVAKAHQLQQFQAQRLQAFCLVIYIVGGLFARALANVAAAQKVGIAQHGRHGGFDLVCKSGHEVIAAAHFVFQAFHSLFYRSSHGVEILAEAPHFIPRMHLRALAILPGGNAGGSSGKPFQRAQHDGGEA